MNRANFIDQNYLTGNKLLLAVIIATMSFAVLVISSCNQNDKKQKTKETPDKSLLPDNLLIDMNESDLKGFQWENTPAEFTIDNGSLMVRVGKGTDYFISPEDGKATSTAPVLYRHMAGDFVAIAKVQPDLSELWSAGAIMVLVNETNWIKFGFENSDATGPSIVSVTTRELSDDANGAILNGIDEVWLKLARKGHNYGMYWSLDGENYQMARLSAMPAIDSVKVGIEAQSPVGEEAVHKFEYFSVKAETVNDIRAGE